MGKIRTIRPTTIKRQIVLFLIRTGIHIVGIIVLWFLLTEFLVRSQILIPSNYAEQYIKDNIDIIISAEQVSDAILPEGSTFSMFSYNNGYRYGNMQEEDRKVAASVAANRYSHLTGHYMYYIINRGKDMCIVKYSLEPVINLGGAYFFNYNLLTVIILLLCCTASLLIEINRITGRWLTCFKVIEDLTSVIRNKELEFECPRTYIKEFDQVIDSMHDMGTSLVQSLQRQWEMEQSRNQQIAALAHDVKIPLTIIKGNAQLMGLADNDQERSEYTRSILSGESRIEHYVDHILKLSHLQKSSELKRQKISADTWLKTLLTEAGELAKVYEQSIIYSPSLENTTLLIDKELMSSALLNIIMNGCEHSPRISNLFLDTKVDDNYFIITVKDSGPGFTEEAISHATTLFYMDDKSRGKLNHYGIGLTMADMIVISHGGILTIKNTEQHHGCVIVKIPL